MNEGLKFPTDVAQLVDSNWDGSEKAWWAPPPLPPVTRLTHFLDTCFFATLQREEGRNTQFHLALMDETQIGQKWIYRYSKFTFVHNLIRLKPPRPLAVNELVRLAPACNPEKTIVLAQIRDSVFQIWGIVDVGWPSFGPHATHGLSVRGLAPGEMEIYLHNRRLCLYKSGGIHLERGGLINDGRIYECLKETSFDLCREVRALLNLPVNQPIHERHVDAIMYFRGLDRLIRSMQRLGHGGCILMVPDITFDCASANVAVKYTCADDRCAAWTALKGAGVNTAVEIDGHVQDPGEAREVEKGLAEALEALAHLSAVDGAVLMTKKFQLIGFGAVVGFSTDTYEVFCADDRRGCETKKVDVERYGTRHRSAFDFCYRCPDAVAFVVSQDGGIKAVTRVADNVCFWEGVSFDLSNELTDWSQASSGTGSCPAASSTALR